MKLSVKYNLDIISPVKDDLVVEILYTTDSSVLLQTGPLWFGSQMVLDARKPKEYTLCSIVQQVLQ